MLKTSSVNSLTSSMSFVSGSCSNGTTTDANSLFECKSKSVGPTMLSRKKREKNGAKCFMIATVFLLINVKIE